VSSDTHAPRADWWARSLGVAALLVGALALWETRRTANSAEDQIRPRVQFRDPVATIRDDDIVLSVAVKNVGKSPCSIQAARVDMVFLRDGGEFGMEFTDIAGDIVNENDARPAVLTIVRSPKLGENDVRVDFTQLDPSKFRFSVTYVSHSTAPQTYSESFTFPTLKWTRQSARAKK